jgi:hypothetical protein
MALLHGPHLAAPALIRAAEAIGDRGRDRRFRGERRQQAGRLAAIQRDTYAEVLAQLRRAQRIVAGEIAGAATPSRATWLPNVERAVRAALREAGDGAAAASEAGLRRTWSAGGDLVDAPLAAGGVRLSALLPSIDLAQLDAMRTFTTARMRDVPLALVERINGHLAQVAIGTQSVGDAIGAIDGLVEGGRGRALTIVRTELGRAYSTAAQERMEQAAEHVPGLKKEWRKSGKLHPRPTHVAADGQVRAVDEPFRVGAVDLMYPRDPGGPPGETINCGCTSLPVVEGWD